MTELKLCPKDDCFYWITPGGAADMSGQIYQSLEESFAKGKWKEFPDGGCSCRHKCSRLHDDSKTDYFESC